MSLYEFAMTDMVYLFIIILFAVQIHHSSVSLPLSGTIITKPTTMFSSPKSTDQIASLCVIVFVHVALSPSTARLECKLSAAVSV